MALPSKTLLDEGERGEWDTIWAFCLRTSAGVRIKHETSSPAEEATELVTGVGREVWPSIDFVPSYVVKNAPAWRYQYLVGNWTSGDTNKRVWWRV